MVSDSIDGPQLPVTFPIDLRGQFQRIDETPIELSTRDLFRKELPVCVYIDKQDPGIGFDPLITKKSFQVTKIVSGLLICCLYFRQFANTCPLDEKFKVKSFTILDSYVERYLKSALPNNKKLRLEKAGSSSYFHGFE